MQDTRKVSSGRRAYADELERSDLVQYRIMATYTFKMTGPDSMGISYDSHVLSHEFSVKLVRAAMKPKQFELLATLQRRPLTEKEAQDFARLTLTSKP